MQTNQRNEQIVNLQVTDGLTVAVIKDASHEFLMPTKDVAIGYGVSEGTIRSHKSNWSDEIIENTHFLPAVEIFDGSQKRTVIMWTKAGVIRLGMYIKSERAKMFRDWVEKIVLQTVAPSVQLPAATPRKHNRLTSNRLLEIMTDIALIDDKELRIRLMQKILPESMTSVQISLPFKEKGGTL